MPGIPVERVEGQKPTPAMQQNDQAITYTSESSRSSDDDSDVSDRRQKRKWPRIQANKQAQWRCKAMVGRANPDGTAAGDRPNSNQDSDIQVNDDTGKKADGPDRCRETLVHASAENEQSESIKTPAVDCAPLLRDASDAKKDHLSDEQDWKQFPQRLIRGSGVGDPIQDTPIASGAFSVCSDRLNPFLADPANQQHIQALDELQPTMAESLSAITERFLNIDVLDERRDLSRFIAFLIDTIELLATRIAFLEAKSPDSGSRSSASEEGSPPSTSSGSRTDAFVGQVLHRVLCSTRSHHHDISHYEDKPTYRDRHSGGEGKLMGDKIVHSVDDYLDAQPNVSFLVIKEQYCSNNAKDEDHTVGHDRRLNSALATEKLQIIAPQLQKALRQVAEYYPGSEILTLGYYSEMRAPYPFLFHHHKKLEELALDETYEGVLSPLLDFLATNYSDEYEEAKCLFDDGMVTAHHISKLFKPSQMVIARQESNVPDAYVLASCHASAREKVSLVGWSWEYDGKELKRQPWEHTIDGVADERMPIADLGVHPADFARAEDMKNLEERGRKFWKMRNQAYICYTGWDKDELYHYVRGEAVTLHDSGTPQLD